MAARVKYHRKFIHLGEFYHSSSLIPENYVTIFYNKKGHCSHDAIKFSIKSEKLTVRNYYIARATIVSS